MTILSKGSQGPYVSSLQTGLTNLGFSLGSIDGIFGAKTQAALIEFQSTVDIPQTGILDPETLERLNEILSMSGFPEVVEKTYNYQTLNPTSSNPVATNAGSKKIIIIGGLVGAGALFFLTRKFLKKK